MTDSERFRSTRYWPALDGLRAIAVLLVVGFHAQAPGFQNGSYGVTLFFALSGFLISTLLLRERRATGEINLAGFYRRRAARIFPAYYAVLAIYCVITWRMEAGTPEGAAFWQHLPDFAFYLTNWTVGALPHGGRVIFLFAWSLAVEEQFYLVWPSVLRWTTGLTVPLVIALLASAAHWYFTAIGYGCALALLADNERTRDVVVRVLSARITLPLAMIGIATAAFVGRGWPTPIYAAIATLAVGAAAVGGSRVLAMRPLRYVGRVSYGVYLLHTLALHVATKLIPGHGYPTAVLGAMIAIAAASVSFFGMELPIQRWARARHLKTPEPVAAIG